jgi:molybdate transport system substrate-binding protein
MRALFALILTLSAPPATAERAVTVFAAASMAGPLEEIAEASGSRIVFAYGGSGAMARQVAAGAPADLVILANPVWMTWLSQQGLDAAANPQIIAGNRLVVIGPKGSTPLSAPARLPARLQGARLAMGQRDAVPAGGYARQWLIHAGIWGDLSSQLAETDNVRAALALVARGEVPFGVVYRSDALSEPLVDVAYLIPEGAHDPIRYTAAGLTAQGAAFLADLSGPKAKMIFAAHGFEGQGK